MKIDIQKKFAAVYNKEADEIFRFCLYRISDREKAKDLVQDTFLRYWNSLSAGENIKNDRAFIFTIARNLIIDWYRKKKALSLENMLEKDDQVLEIRDDSFQANVEMGAEARFSLSKINELHPSHREVVYLRFVEGLGPQEIAEVLHESPNAISVKINRAMKDLRNILKANEEN